MKLISTYVNGQSRLAKVYRDAALDEYVVWFYEDGVRRPETDYYTNDVTDAHGTAHTWVNTETNHE